MQGLRQSMDAGSARLASLAQPVQQGRRTSASRSAKVSLHQFILPETHVHVRDQKRISGMKIGGSDKAYITVASPFAGYEKKQSWSPGPPVQSGA